MNELIIHRKAAFGHALCGKRVSVDETTLNDSIVTCEECSKILHSITNSEAKTSVLNRLVHKREK